MSFRSDRLTLWADAAAGPSSVSVRRSWMVFAASIAALACFATVLPAPWTAVQLLVSSTDTISGVTGALAVSQSACLTVAATTVWLLLVWAGSVAAVALLGNLPGAAGSRCRRVLRFIAPAVARNLVVGVVGASLATGLAGCATGAPSHADAVSARPSPVAATRSWIAVEGSAVQLRAVTGVARVVKDDPHLTGRADALHVDVDWPVAEPVRQGPVDIDWPTAASAAPKSPRHDPVDIDWPSRPSQAEPSAGQPVVVVRGDTLWTIAKRHLPATASAGDIDHAWHEWYSLNIAVIGPDPDVILPGQILLPPAHRTGK